MTHDPNPKSALRHPTMASMPVMAVGLPLARHAPRASRWSRCLTEAPMSSLPVFVAFQLTVLLVVSGLFALLVSRIRKREPRATIRNILYASLFSLLAYACMALFFVAPVIGLTTAVIMLLAAALYIVVSRPTWSRVAADGLVAITLLALVLGVLGVVG